MAKLGALPAVLLLLATSPLLAHAQNLATVVNYSRLPQCAQSCALLKTAEAGCVPQQGGLGAPVSNQQTYQQCFCTSSFLIGLRSSPQAVCTDVCTSPQDLTQIQGWFIGACDRQEGWPEQQNNQQPPGQQPPGQQPPPNPRPPPPATTTAAAAPGQNAPQEQSWIAGHWKWVLMLIIIALAMVIGAVLGLWWKRRHQRRVDARNANVGALDGGRPSASAAEKGKQPLPPPPVAPASRAGPADKPEMTATASTLASGASGKPQRPAPPPPLVRPSSGSILSKSRSRSGTAGSGALVWGPHQNMAASGGYDSPTTSIGPGGAGNRTSSVYGDTTPGIAVPYAPGDLPERVYSPLVNRSVSSLHSGLPSAPPTAGGYQQQSQQQPQQASLSRPGSRPNLAAAAAGTAMRSSSGSIGGGGLQQGGLGQGQQRGASPVSPVEGQGRWGARSPALSEGRIEKRGSGSGSGRKLSKRGSKGSRNAS